jgi:hypothetical protein
MERVLLYLQSFLCVAISASLLHHFSQLSAVTNHVAAVITLICILTWLGAFVADAQIMKWAKTSIEGFRFVLTAIGIAFFVGLLVPNLPAIIDWLGGV